VAKLAGLIEGMAKTLQVSPSRVRTAAAHLRKHKMINSGPRGPGAPDMGPTDAVNLLLAIMYDGELAEAHQTVRRLRQARIRYFDGRRPYDAGGVKLDRLPRNGFITDSHGQGHELGVVLETLLDWWVRYGSVDEDCAQEDDEEYDLETVNITLKVSCPGYRATLTFNSPMGLSWLLEYEWKPPEQIEYENNNRDGFGVRWDARNGPHLWSSRQVGADCLTEIADLLRGSEWQDGWEEFAPAYDATIEQALEQA
jgi:hypothetical protein